ncbi:cytochrome P450 [Nonomuraea sp. NBC_01738]|uniref:cytochrome P450 n=1 Tax=Nonomuraea sp. NBC_01738 TaxID=2976003 RepID=UPI002E0F65C8|nr:cytochrome P450 [Nonomuraea sp. NBC_01738]
MTSATHDPHPPSATTPAPDPTPPATAAVAATATKPAPTPAPLPRNQGGCPFDPPGELQRLRAEHPVSPLVMADGTIGWLVTRADDVRAVLADPAFSADIMKASNPVQVIPEEARSLPPDPAFFIHADQPEHTRYRKLLMGQFTMRRVRELEPRIEEIVAEHLTRMRVKGSADLVKEFALPVPSLVICELLGVPYEERERFQTLTTDMLRADATPMEIGTTAYQLRLYLGALVTAKREAPDGAIISGLIEDGSGLTDEELTSIAMLLLIGGHETTANQLGLSVFALLREPERYRLLADDPTLIPDAVEELLRYLPLSQFGVTRLAKRDVEVGGVLIRAGESVSLSVSAANRDPDRFYDPDTLDLTRRPTQHLAFGHGIHLCIGQALARAELRIALHALVTSYPGLRLAVPAEDVPLRHEMLIYGAAELPVTW